MHSQNENPFMNKFRKPNKLQKGLNYKITHFYDAPDLSEDSILSSLKCSLAQKSLDQLPRNLQNESALDSIHEKFLARTISELEPHSMASLVINSVYDLHNGDIDIFKKFPYSAIVSLEIESITGELLEGTGFMIGPRHLLTSVQHIKNKVYFAKRIFAIPGRHKSHFPFSVVKVIKSWDYDYTKGNMEKYSDWAILELEINIGNYTGWFGLMSYDQERIKSLLNVESMEAIEINMAGFDKSETVENEHGKEQLHRTMRTQAGKIINIQDEGLVYKIDSFSGQSGSPIWIQEGQECIVIAIHNNYNEVKKYSCGSLMSDIKISSIVKWMNQNEDTYWRNEYLNLMKQVFRMGGEDDNKAEESFSFMDTTISRLDEANDDAFLEELDMKKNYE